MRKRVFGRKFKRDINERKALMKGLIKAFILHGKVKTTEAKAKAVKGQIEQYVTKAKKKGQNAFSHLSRELNIKVAEKLVNRIAPAFANRPGGYIRLLRLGRRLKDNAQLVLMEWVESVDEVKSEKKEEKKEEIKKEAKKRDLETKSNEKPNHTNKKK